MSRFLLIGLVALAGCSAARPGTDQIAQEGAERRALVAAMEKHPGLKEGQGSASEGKPLTFSTAVRPRPKAVEPAHHHAPDTPHHD
jgi:hypothetical protein